MAPLASETEISKFLMAWPNSEGGSFGNQDWAPVEADFWLWEPKVFLEVRFAKWGSVGQTKTPFIKKYGFCHGLFENRGFGARSRLLVQNRCKLSVHIIVFWINFDKNF